MNSDFETIIGPGPSKPCEVCGDTAEEYSMACLRCSQDKIIRLAGGVRLTPWEAKQALDGAMNMIQSIGTVDVGSCCQQAKKWMEKLYPNWS